MNAFLYCLGLSAQKYKIRLHTVSLMSNHYHGVNTDTLGNMLEFLQYFHRMLALAMQEIRDWEHGVMERGQTSLVELLDDEAVVEKALYALMNPVKAGICPREDAWPGTLRQGTYVAKRPARFTNKMWPAEVTVTFEPPPGFDERAWQRVLDDRIDEERKDARSLARRSPSSKRAFRYLGVRNALRVPPTSMPRTPTPKGKLSPRFASRCKKSMLHAIRRLHVFYEGYQDALKCFREGQTALFPEGTWKMVQCFGCHCAT